MIQEHEPPKEKETAPSHITESDVLVPEEQSLLKEVEKHPQSNFYTRKSPSSRSLTYS